MMAMTRAEAECRLKQIFGIDRFYDEQWQAVSRILAGERVLMIERTSFGKSLCYQFPATQFPGITIIFSPLIALMRDQVASLNRRGINAAFINSEQSPEDNHNVIEQAIAGQLKILYIAPERQENTEWVSATRRMKLSMVVIDEAHTVSTWGHDFRPAFRRIIDLVRLLPATMPVLATTATATTRVQHDIERQIGGQLTTIRGSLARDNFRLRVVRVQSENEKLLWLASNIDKLEGCGLIYTGTRVNTELYSRWLQFIGVDAINYHAGFEAGTRVATERGLMSNRWKCIVSTNALGMGLDKPDIRFVIHTQIPVSPIHYYQEIGRAGRDGKPTDIILFYNEAVNRDGVPEDQTLPRAFIEGARPARAKYERVIELLREEPLSEREITKRANLKSTQTRVIRADLIEQGIIKEALYGRTKKYEYQFDAPVLDFTRYEELRQMKLRELERMVEYVHTSMPRMQFLCGFLDSNEPHVYSNCDNTTLEPWPWDTSEEAQERLHKFRENYLPVLDTADVTTQQFDTADGRREKLGVSVPFPGRVALMRDGAIVTIVAENDMARLLPTISSFTDEEKNTLIALYTRHREKKSRMTDGVAAAYYGVSQVGNALHRCKYEHGGDFPSFLLRLTMSAFYKKYSGVLFDMVMYVPPTVSGNLVRNFAQTFANAVKLPLSDAIVKTRTTSEQKIFQNTFSKQDNVQGAFDIVGTDVTAKSIILIDDIYDSGATIREIGRLLTARGASYIVPLVIAKTIGGTQ